MLRSRGMVRHPLVPFALPILALYLLAAGCTFGGASASGRASSPCPEGQACTDAAGHPGVCDGFGCEVACTLGEADCCVVDQDCAALGQDQNPGVCAKETGTCVLACATDADCASVDHVAGDCHGPGCVCDRGACHGPVCDRGACHVPPCSSDADCGSGARCVAGTCGPGVAATACEVLPGPLTLTPGAVRPLTALARDGSGPVLPATPFAWCPATRRWPPWSRPPGRSSGAPGRGRPPSPPRRGPPVAPRRCATSVPGPAGSSGWWRWTRSPTGGSRAPPWSCARAAPSSPRG